MVRTTVAVLIATAVATPAAADGENSDTLREIVGAASIVVRGHEATAPAGPSAAGQRYTQLHVAEIIKGSVDDNTLLLREPSDAPPVELDRDVIVLLGPQAEDGSYPVVRGFASGRYAVDHAHGDAVMVNASGVDADSVPAKDTHHRSENEAMPIDEFRHIVKGDTTPSTDPASRPHPVVPTTTTAGTAAQPPPVPARDESGGVPWLAIVLAAVGLGLLVVVIRRART